MSDADFEVGGVFDDGFDLDFYPGLLSPKPPSPAEAEDETIVNPLRETDSSWFKTIENILMNDDEECGVTDYGQGQGVGVDDVNERYYDEFVSEILLEAPAADRSSSELSPQSDVSDFNGGSEKDKEIEVAARVDDKSDYEADDDPDSKKRKRQLRNKDAALRSRERKKIYVKDLEVKSRYLEGECRRLGRLLQCCYAENQDLRFRLFHTMGNGATGASMTKQESAVLFLESLLLGSLFWFLGIMCLCHLPKLPCSNGEAMSLQENDPRSVHQRRAANKLYESPNLGALLNSRRCKALRTRMKPLYAAAGSSSFLVSVV